MRKKSIYILKTSCWEANTKIATKGILKVNKRKNTAFALLQSCQAWQFTMQEMVA